MGSDPVNVVANCVHRYDQSIVSDTVKVCDLGQWVDLGQYGTFLYRLTLPEIACSNLTDDHHTALTDHMVVSGAIL